MYSFLRANMHQLYIGSGLRTHVCVQNHGAGHQSRRHRLWGLLVPERVEATP